jgi:hypothetical protein
MPLNQSDLLHMAVEAQRYAQNAALILDSDEWGAEYHWITIRDDVIRVQALMDVLAREARCRLDLPEPKTLRVDLSAPDLFSHLRQLHRVWPRQRTESP